jgi:hypothetical protein
MGVAIINGYLVLLFLPVHFGIGKAWLHRATGLRNGLTEPY